MGVFFCKFESFHEPSSIQVLYFSNNHIFEELFSARLLIFFIFHISTTLCSYLVQATRWDEKCKSKLLKEYTNVCQKKANIHLYRTCNKRSSSSNKYLHAWLLDVVNCIVNGSANISFINDVFRSSMIFHIIFSYHSISPYCENSFNKTVVCQSQTFIYSRI